MTNPPESVLTDFYNLFCGKVLGEGAARKVYEHNFDGKVVIKVETGDYSFQNITEWQTWERVKHTDLAQYFAPCVAISPNGRVLVQRRTSRPTYYPDKVPAFFTDLKLDNFGVLTNGNVFVDDVFDVRNPKGAFVCHDYGMHMMLEKGMTKRMRKAEWWTL
jgi:hypothetical protein